MSRLSERLTDQRWRHAMGRQFEAVTDEIFQVIRWVLVVGFASYLSKAHDSLILHVTYWVLSVLLFGYISSRFLLRPEIAFLGNPEGRAARLLQSLLNFLLCVVVFALTLYAVSELTRAIATYRSAI